MVKNPPANTGDTRYVASISGLGRAPGVGNGTPTPVFLSGKFRGQRSLMGYSAWGHKELYTAEQLCTHIRIYNLLARSLVKGR